MLWSNKATFDSLIRRAVAANSILQITHAHASRPGKQNAILQRIWVSTGFLRENGKGPQCPQNGDTTCLRSYVTMLKYDPNATRDLYPASSCIVLTVIIGHKLTTLHSHAHAQSQDWYRSKAVLISRAPPQ